MSNIEHVSDVPHFDYVRTYVGGLPKMRDVIVIPRGSFKEHVRVKFPKTEWTDLIERCLAHGLERGVKEWLERSERPAEIAPVFSFVGDNVCYKVCPVELARQRRSLDYVSPIRRHAWGIFHEEDYEGGRASYIGTLPVMLRKVVELTDNTPNQWSSEFNAGGLCVKTLVGLYNFHEEDGDGDE